MAKANEINYDEIDRQKQQWDIEIARQTELYARDNGCFRNEDGDIANTFTVTENETHRPVWLKWFEAQKVKEHHWPDIQTTMILLRIPIAVTSEGLHYIGYPGEQGTIIAHYLNHILTREDTLERYIAALWDSGEFETSRQYISGENARIKKELKQLEADQVIMAFFESRNCFATQTGIPRQISFAEHQMKLLKSGTDS